MLNSPGSEAQFALRAHIVQYPEGVICAWIMLAVKVQDLALSDELQMLGRVA